MDYTPRDWDAPDWDNAGRVHDWKNYVNKGVRANWATFSDELKMMLARQAAEWSDGVESGHALSKLEGPARESSRRGVESQG